MSGFLDTRELETAYFEITSELERQLLKFGSVKTFKVLRASEGYHSAGNVLVEYDRLEAAILCKFTIEVYYVEEGHEVQWETCAYGVLQSSDVYQWDL